MESETEITIDLRTEEISVLEEIRDNHIEADSYLIFSQGIEIAILVFILIAVLWRKL